MERITLTIPDIQKALGIGRDAAYALANRADFPAIRVGRKIVVPCDAFRRWLDRQTTEKLEGA